MLRLSVIVPSLNRAESLREALRSLSAQTLRRSDFEVIVVDDGSTDHTPAVLAEPWPFELRVIRQETRGAVEARNTAAQAASGGLLVFVDDDMSFDPLYLEALRDLHGAPEPRIGMGAVLPDLDNPVSRFHRIHAVGNADAPPFEAESESPFARCTTNNLSAPKDVFFSLGGFRNPVGDGPGTWTDVEFGARAAAAGLRCWRSGRALCIHRDYSIHTFDNSLRRAYRVSRTVPALIQVHPCVRSRLTMYADMWPIELRSDPPALILRKLARTALSVGPVRAALETLARGAAAVAPADAIVRPIYRWALGGALYRGLRDGLRAVEGDGSRSRPAPLCSASQG